MLRCLEGGVIAVDPGSNSPQLADIPEEGYMTPRGLGAWAWLAGYKSGLQYQSELLVEGKQPKALGIFLQVICLIS